MGSGFVGFTEPEPFLLHGVWCRAIPALLEISYRYLHKQLYNLRINY